MNRILSFVRVNKAFTGIIFLYVFAMLSVIHWGIPNAFHPYTYHMDEWHQLQAVKSVFTKGTPNIEGAANGPMFQFLLSGLYLVPFVLFGFVNPFVITSSVSSLLEQERLFMILRLNTLMFGVLSLFVLYKMAKDHLKINPLLTIYFFAATPIWLSLSNYFKYDIALIFWILLTLLFIFRYKKQPTFYNFLLIGIASGLATATKITAVPLFPILIFSFYYFTPQPQRKYRFLLWGIVSFVLIFAILGVPDILFRKEAYFAFFYSNIVVVPKESSNFVLGMPYWLFLFTNQFPTIFGRLFFFFFLMSLVFWITQFIKSFKKKRFFSDKEEFFIFVAFLFFAASLIPLKLCATGNRALVLLPFFALLTGLALRRILPLLKSVYRKFFIGIIAVTILVQTIESYSWVSLKQKTDPRQSASMWLKNHLKKETTIGIENIPIYQKLPDIVLKEFYEDDVKKNRYSYTVIDVNSKNIPPFVIVTDYDIALFYQKRSEKKSLIQKLAKLQYKKIQEFRPNTKLLLYFNSWLDIFISGIVPSPSIAIYRRA